MHFKHLSLVAETPERRLFGYALVKIKYPIPSNTLDLFNSSTSKISKFIGEVTSIAVHDHHRGKGVAKQLMTCLHFNIATQYAIDEMYLFVRVNASNIFYHCTCFLLQMITSHCCDQDGSETDFSSVLTVHSCTDIKQNARKLFENVFQYSLDRIELSYYLDGEDACYMNKPHLLRDCQSWSLTKKEIDRITLSEDKL